MKLPKAAYKILDEVEGGSFGEGGCWLLAQALVIAGKASEVWVLWKDDIAQHCVARNKAQFIDVDGKWSAAYFEQDGKGGELRLWEGESLGEIPVSQEAAQKLALLLK